MPAVIRRLRFHDGSIRLGPECFAWGDPYTRALSFEIERVNVAVIGGLAEPRLTKEEYRWLETAMIDAGLRGAIVRVITDQDGKPILDANGEPKMRRVMCAMPALKRRNRPAPSGSGLTQRKIIDMTKKHVIPNPAEAKNADGTFDLEKVKTAAGLAMENLENGHAKILSFEETVPPGGVGRRFILDVDGH